MGGKGSGNKHGTVRGSYNSANKRKRYVSTVALRKQISDPRILRDRLFASSTIKDETAKLLLCEAVATLRYEKNVILRKRESGLASTDEEKRIQILTKDIHRALRDLGCLANTRDDDEPDVSYEEEGDIKS